MQDSREPVRPDPPLAKSSSSAAVVGVMMVLGVSVLTFLYALLGTGLLFLILVVMAIIAAGAFHFWMWGRSMSKLTDDQIESQT